MGLTVFLLSSGLFGSITCDLMAAGAVSFDLSLEISPSFSSSWSSKPCSSSCYSSFPSLLSSGTRTSLLSFLIPLHSDFFRVASISSFNSFLIYFSSELICSSICLLTYEVISLPFILIPLDLASNLLSLFPSITSF